ncbi:hypothetical protein ACVWWO_003453 [Bradyrhizobium sp. F1.13.1]
MTSTDDTLNVNQRATFTSTNLAFLLLREPRLGAPCSEGAVDATCATSRSFFKHRRRVR